MSSNTNSLRYLVKNTSILSVINVFVTITGVIADIVIVGLFGLTQMTDIFFIAITIPLVIVSATQLETSNVITPLFIKLREKQGIDASWEYVNKLISVIVTIFILALIIGFFLSPLLIKFQAPGIPGANLKEGIVYSQLLFLLPLLRCPGALFITIANASRIFGLPGVTRILENGIKIIIILSWHRKMGVMAMVIANLAAAAFQSLFLFLIVYKLGYRLRFCNGFKDPYVIKTLKLSIFPVTGNLFSMTIQIVQNVLSSYLTSGSLSALRYATRIIDVFAGVLAGSIATVLLPVTSEDLVNKGEHSIKENISRGLDLLFTLTVPFSIWLALMSNQFIGFLYERMNFSATDTHLVANLMLLMIPYILLSRFISIVETAFFSYNNTLTPMLNTLFLTLTIIMVNLLLFPFFKIHSMALSRTIGYIASCIFFSVLFMRRYGAFDNCMFLKKIVKLLISSLFLVVGVYVGKLVIKSYTLRVSIEKLINFMIPSIFSLFFFTSAYFIINRQKIKDILKNRRP